jgi:hypothetical protein
MFGRKQQEQPQRRHQQPTGNNDGQYPRWLQRTNRSYRPAADDGVGALTNEESRRQICLRKKN